jgi:RNA polymerase sigma-70 factor (ECF subfamily)
MNAPFGGKDGERRFAELCDGLRPQLYRFAFWLARDRQVAEDVLQEAYMRAWASRDNLGAEGALKGWLLTIVRREHARLFERKRLPTVSVDELVASDAPELAVTEQHEVMEMRRAIFALDPDYREPLVLQVLMGYSTGEIADELGLSQSAVLTRLFRARHRLRQQLGVGPEAETE